MEFNYYYDTIAMASIDVEDIGNCAIEAHTDLKCLDVVRNIIKRNVDKGLLPNFKYGLIDFEHLYSTIGINGIYETMKTFGYIYQDEFKNNYYKEEAYKFGKKIFDVIHEIIVDFSKDKDYKINIDRKSTRLNSSH